MTASSWRDPYLTRALGRLFVEQLDEHGFTARTKDLAKAFINETVAEKLQEIGADVRLVRVAQDVAREAFEAADRDSNDSPQNGRPAVVALNTPDPDSQPTGQEESIGNIRRTLRGRRPTSRLENVVVWIALASLAVCSVLLGFGTIGALIKYVRWAWGL